MNAQLLIDAVVRQTTVLIAQLATAGGVRAPLAQVANQVFAQLAAELERQGLSRKVTADMFGITLRSYQRKVQRLSESATERGRSLWEAVVYYLEQSPVATRRQVIERFHRDEEENVRGILHDLVESGLAFCSGGDREAVYRLATGEEMEKMRDARKGRGMDDLVCAIILREGPVERERLRKLVKLEPEVLQELVDRLSAEGRVQKQERGDGSFYYRSEKLVVPLGAPVGWEASVYDHYQAVVRTICARLQDDGNCRDDPDAARFRELNGGCTYTFDVGPDHPLEAEVLQTLADIRARCSDLRRRVNEHNQQHGPVHPGESVVVYAGQCVIPLESEGDDGARTGSPRGGAGTEEVQGQGGM